MKFVFCSLAFIVLSTAAIQARAIGYCVATFRQPIIDGAELIRIIPGVDTLTGEKYELLFKTYVRYGNAAEDLSMARVLDAATGTPLRESLRIKYGLRKRFYINIELDNGDFLKIETKDEPTQASGPVDYSRFIKAEDINGSDLLYRFGREERVAKSRKALIAERLDRILKKGNPAMRRLILEYGDLLQEMILKREVSLENVNDQDALMGRDLDTGTYHGILLNRSSFNLSWVFSPKTFWSAPQAKPFNKMKRNPGYSLSNGWFLANQVQPVSRSTIYTTLFRTVHQTGRLEMSSFLY